MYPKNKKRVALLKTLMKSLKYPDVNAILSSYYKYITSINKIFVEKYHCPLRYQGNFINKSISSFESIASQIKFKEDSRNADESTKDITSSIKELLKIDPRSIDTVSNKKLVILTCIRIDKDDGLDRSFQFAHCINPMKNTGHEFINCSDINEQRGGKQTKVNLLNYVDFKVSQDIIDGMYFVGAINLIKTARYKYYQMNKNKSNIEELIFKDYLTTLILATILYAIKLDKLSFILLFDSMLSIATYYNLKDIKVFLSPFYLPALCI
jgi:hypothetical protein